MYLPINGYGSLKELAEEWEVTENAIRMNARGNMVSAKVSSLIDDFISEGEKRFQEHRNSKVANTNA